VTKSLSRLSSLELLNLQKSSLKNILDLTKSSLSLVHYCFSTFQSLYALSIYFSMSMLEPTTSNSFSKRTQPASILVIINKEPEYEISWIVDSEINHWQACKLLYKMIWLGYEDTKDKSEWIPTSELSYATDLISDFHIVYPTKPSPLSLSQSCCNTCSLPLYTSNRDYYYFLSIFYLFFFINLIFHIFFIRFFFKLLDFNFTPIS